MKIGIYGDSYASPTPHNNFQFIEEMWDDRSWTYPLKQEFQVKNFAKAGTCIWYSFDLFQKTFQEFDAIVFAWTDYTRIHLDEPFEGYSATLSHPAALAGYLREGTKCRHGNSNHDEYKDRVYKVLNTASIVLPWMVSIPQQKYLAEKCFLDVQHLCRAHNKRLVNICTFEDHDSIPNVFAREQRSGPMLTGLQKVSDRETRIKNRDNVPFYDDRSNHLFPVNNMALLKLVRDRLLDPTMNDIYDCQHSNEFQYSEEDWDAHFQA